MPDRLSDRRQSALYLVVFGLGAAFLFAVAVAAGVFGRLGPDDPGRTLEPSSAAGRPPGQSPAQPPAVSPSRAPASSPAASSPTPHVEPVGNLPLVPVVGFWSGATDISSAELSLALQGRSAQFERIVVPEADRQDIEALLGISLADRVEGGDAAAIRRQVREGALGLMRVTDVTPAVRALSLDGQSLFGNDRLASTDEWPLHLPADEAAAEWQQADRWTLVAGGDIQLDRWMAHHVTALDKGVDWPWEGGRVGITGRVCCSDLGHRVPEWERTGEPGAVRALFTGADLAMANLEAAAVDDPGFHRLPANFPLSLSFSGDPRLLDGLRNAGFDFLSLANNHIHNAGAQGIIDTRQNLAERDIAFAGAGRDLAQSRRPGELEVGGQSVVMLPCTVVGRVARADRAGSAPCTGERLLRQIQEAQPSDVVIVFPHWGREYRATPNAGQRALARAWAEAGADLVLGAHSHWAGSVEEIGRSLVFYSLGNLAFDQPWSEPTMQGVIVELTFNADRLVQAHLHPTLIVDHVQPNLLEYEAGGDRVLRRMRDASEGLLPY